MCFRIRRIFSNFTGSLFILLTWQDHARMSVGHLYFSHFHTYLTSPPCSVSLQIFIYVYFNVTRNAMSGSNVTYCICNSELLTKFLQCCRCVWNALCMGSRHLYYTWHRRWNLIMTVGAPVSMHAHKMGGVSSHWCSVLNSMFHLLSESLWYR